METLKNNLVAWLLFVYLAVVTYLIGWALLSLWCLDLAIPPQSGASSALSARPPAVPVPSVGAPPAVAPKPEPPQPPPPAPALKELRPNTLETGQDRPSILLIGSNFTKDDEVLLDGVKPTRAEFISSTQILVPLDDTLLVTPGKLQVWVRRGVAVSGPVEATIKKRKESWSFLWFSLCVTPEVRLLLLVLLTSSFAACVVGLRSLVDYIGSKKLEGVWAPQYLARPILGAGIGLIFYLVVRAGLVGGSVAEARSVNVFGISAVAALVGAFTDKAYNKLFELSETIFSRQNPDPRPGNLASLAVTTKSLPVGKVSQNYSAKLEAKDGTPPLKWSVTPTLPGGLTLSPEGELSGQPSAAGATKHTFTVTDSSAKTAKADLDLKIEN